MKKLIAPKNKARKLRLEGWSYDRISSKLGVAKSTLHDWFVPLPQSQFQKDPAFRITHLAKIRHAAVAAIKAKKADRIKKIHDRVTTELTQFPFNNILVQKAILSFLYWAEGSKTVSGMFKFANTDPELSLLFLTLMRNCLPIEEKRISIWLHLHYYHNVSKTRLFWSKLLSVPLEQFAKVYIKSRRKTKKKKKNFAGICFIRYGAGAETLRQDVLYFARSIQEKLAPMRP